MKNALLKCVAGLALTVCQTVLAGPITDTVIVGSQEWAQVDLFTNVSWNTLNSQCPGGVCTLASAINGHDLNGWTWASVDTVQDLFNTYTGQATSAPGSYSEAGSAWAPAMLNEFRVTLSLQSSLQLYGLSSSLWPDDNIYALAPFMYNRIEALGLDTARTSHITGLDDHDDYIGAWFVRDVPQNQVPVPATLTLFGLGLASMLITRRKRGAKV